MKKIDRVGTVETPHCPYCGGPARCAACGQTCSEAGGLTENELCVGCATNKKGGKNMKKCNHNYTAILTIKGTIMQEIICRDCREVLGLLGPF